MASMNMRNCLFCLEPLKIQDRNNVLLKGEENLYKSIFECSQELIVDVLKRDISKDYMPTPELPSPMCFMCFKKSEKVYLVRKQLTEFQRQLKKLIEELIIEINSRYSQNLIQCTLNEGDRQRVLQPNDVHLSIQQDYVKLSSPTDDDMEDGDIVDIKEEILEDEECQGYFSMKFSEEISSADEIRDNSQRKNGTARRMENSKVKNLRDLIESSENSISPRVILKRLEVKGNSYIAPENSGNSQEKITISVPPESVKCRKIVNGKPHESCEREHCKMVRHKKDRYGCLRTPEIGCCKCDKKFRSSQLLKVHMAIAHGERCYFECEICGKKSSTRTNHRIHRTVHLKAEGKKHCCEICGKRYYYRNGVNRHRRRKHGKDSKEMEYKCDICGDKLFLNPETLRRHQEIHHVPYTNVVFYCQKCGQKFLDGVHMFWHSRKKEVTHSRHNCPLCAEKFLTRCDLLIHYSDSHPNENLPDKCAQCQLTFNSKLAWERHVKDCDTPDCVEWLENEKMFVCKICEEKLHEDAIQVHKSLHSSKKSISCGQCRKTFSSKSYLERHEKTHCEPIPCPICGKTFETLGRVKHHERFHNIPAEKLFSCSICSMTFKLKNNLTMHEKTHRSSGDGFDCDLCGKSYFFKFHLDNHKRRVHGDEKEKKKEFLCHICGRGFDSPKSLQYHEKKHNDGKFFMCNQCGMSCKTFIGLAKHENSHKEKLPYRVSLKNESTKRYECDFCEKSYTSIENIQIHTRVKHTGEMPFPCSDCDERFPTFTKLSLHQKRNHKEELDHVCHICGKGFKLAEYLKLHFQTHSKEKQMKCDHCGLIYSTKANLKRHQRTHAGEKPFQCQLCNKSFSQATTLQNHARIHTGERPFICSFCGKDFSDRSTWSKHQKNHRKGK